MSFDRDKFIKKLKMVSGFCKLKYVFAVSTEMLHLKRKTH